MRLFAFILALASIPAGATRIHCSKETLVHLKAVVEADLEKQHLTRLLMRFRGGDTEAFVEFHEIVRPKLIGYLANLGVRHNDQQDIVQETFLDLANMQIHADGDALSLAFKICSRRHTDLLRRRYRRPETSFDQKTDEGDTLAGEMKSAAEAPPQILGRQEESQKYLDALAEAIVYLPNDHRQVLIMMSLEDQDRRTVQNVLGFDDPQKVSNLFSEAKIKVAARLKLALKLEENVPLSLFRMSDASLSAAISAKQAAITEYRIEVQNKLVTLSHEEQVALNEFASRRLKESKALRSGLTKLATVPVPTSIANLHPGIRGFLQSDQWNNP